MTVIGAMRQSKTLDGTRMREPDELERTELEYGGATERDWICGIRHIRGSTDHSASFASEETQSRRGHRVVMLIVCVTSVSLCFDQTAPNQSGHPWSIRNADSSSLVNGDGLAPDVPVRVDVHPIAG